jgi:hypothetical protein
MKLKITNLRTGRHEYIEIIKESRKFGCECSFYRIDNKVGIKLYRSRKRAELTRKNQIAYWKINMAPKIMSVIFRVTGKGALPCWGYLTEVAVVNNTITYQEGFKFWGKINMNENLPRFIDRHNGNLGKIGRKIVAIDFGMGSPDINMGPP